MEKLYRLPNGEVYNFSVNEFCHYPTKIGIDDFCQLTPSFKFRFTEDAFEYNSERILSKYKNLRRSIGIFKPDNDLVVMITQGYAFLIYKTEPVLYIDLVTSEILKCFSNKFLLTGYVYYKEILDELYSFYRRMF
jgi:hypothetical protein